MVKSLLIFLIVVLIGAGVGWAGGQNGTLFHGYWLFALCALLAFVINWLVFIPSSMAQTEKFYDLTGSITYLSVIGLAIYGVGELDTRSQLVAVMVVVWALRLGLFLFTRILQDGHDSRFDEIKVNPLRFLNAWTLQGLWVLLTAACALVIITSANKQPMELLGWLGGIVWLFGFVFETVADAQKRKFRKQASNRGRFISEGLWSWSQHPNYFGEITLWFGVALMALPILQGWQWVCLISPIFVYLLLTKVSGIPLLKQKGAQKWGADPQYQAYLRNTSLLFPRPPKKS